MLPSKHVMILIKLVYIFNLILKEFNLSIKKTKSICNSSYYNLILIFNILFILYFNI